jgi:hypothetical protein
VLSTLPETAPSRSERALPVVKATAGHRASWLPQEPASPPPMTVARESTRASR